MLTVLRWPEPIRSRRWNLISSRDSRRRFFSKGASIISLYLCRFTRDKSSFLPWERPLSIEPIFGIANQYMLGSISWRVFHAVSSELWNFTSLTNNYALHHPSQHLTVQDMSIGSATTVPLIPFEQEDQHWLKERCARPSPFHHVTRVSAVSKGCKIVRTCARTHTYITNAL